MTYDRAIGTHIMAKPVGNDTDDRTVFVGRGTSGLAMKRFPEITSQEYAVVYNIVSNFFE